MSSKKSKRKYEAGVLDRSINILGYPVLLAIDTESYFKKKDRKKTKK